MPSVMPPEPASSLLLHGSWLQTGPDPPQIGAHDSRAWLSLTRPLPRKLSEQSLCGTKEPCPGNASQPDVSPPPLNRRSPPATMPLLLKTLLEAIAPARLGPSLPVNLHLPRWPWLPVLRMGSRGDHLHQIALLRNARFVSGAATVTSSIPKRQNSLPRSSWLGRLFTRLENEHLCSRRCRPWLPLQRWLPRLLGRPGLPPYNITTVGRLTVRPRLLHPRQDPWRLLPKLPGRLRPLPLNLTTVALRHLTAPSRLPHPLPDPW